MMATRSPAFTPSAAREWAKREDSSDSSRKLRISSRPSAWATMTAGPALPACRSMHSCAMLRRSRSPSKSSHSLAAEKCSWASAKLVCSVRLAIEGLWPNACRCTTALVVVHIKHEASPCEFNDASAGAAPARVHACHRHSPSARQEPHAHGCEGDRSGAEARAQHMSPHPARAGFGAAGESRADDEALQPGHRHAAAGARRAGEQDL